MDQRAANYTQWQANNNAYASQRYASQQAVQPNAQYSRPTQIVQQIPPSVIAGVAQSSNSPVTSSNFAAPHQQSRSAHAVNKRSGNPSPALTARSAAVSRPAAPAPIAPNNAVARPPVRALAPKPIASAVDASHRSANGSTLQTHDSVDQDMSDGGEDDDDDSHEPVYQLPPPPENVYANDRECDQAMHAWSLEHGYELVRRASKKNARGHLYKRYYHCSKHGKLANTGKLTDETRVRHNRKSNRIGCPMSLAVIAQDPSNPDGPWEIRHRKVHHNHGPLEGLLLAGHRRRARIGGVEKAVDGLFAIGTPTAQVLQFLERTNPNGLFTRTDVANMKLKYKKYGTCIGTKEASHNSDQRAGMPSACISCRTKKIKCDSQRPECGACSESGLPCQYNHEPSEGRPTLEHDVSMVSNITDGGIDESPQPQPLRLRAAKTPAEPPAPDPRAQAILADLQAFQATHVKAVKLSLQSSVVEVLAASCCGSGDSYKNVRFIEDASQWKTFKDAMTEASRKENTYEVLFGHKVEPTRPPDTHTVDEWNEYIKQLAIFNRRNSALMGALLPRIGGTLRPRIEHLEKAAEVMAVLEDLCRPRGCDQALGLWAELHSTTLQTSANLHDYVLRLETVYMALNRLSAPKSLTQDRANGQRRQSNLDPWKTTSATNGKGSLSVVPNMKTSDNLPKEIYPEWMLCFHFLNNLGPEYQHWVENLCMTNNIGGFGTGRPLEFAELTRLALEQEKIYKQRRSRSNG